MSPELQASNQDQKPEVPTFRIVPHIEGTRSLHFDIIEREAPDGVVIKIGRFTDKSQVPNRVTFKSKVVSRGHAEIWHSEGKFYIKDTKSSSGTFLNHLRLSTPNTESKPHLLKDGDIIQLGVDYQGGTEEIYRCVKMRVELNHSWQRPIKFSLNALKQFKQITQLGNSEGMKQQITDCCICLSGIGPCQALFLAPCSHVFHYKCIRPILFSHHSGFLCPLCRSFADLEAPIDNSIDWEQLLAEQEEAEKLQEVNNAQKKDEESSNNDIISSNNNNNNDGEDNDNNREWGDNLAEEELMEEESSNSNENYDNDNNQAIELSTTPVNNNNMIATITPTITAASSSSSSSSNASATGAATQKATISSNNSATNANSNPPPTAS